MHASGIPSALVASLTDEDMQAIADKAQELVLSEPIEKSVAFVVRLYIAEKGTKRMATNPCSKRVTPHQAYEVWQSLDGSVTYFVLKKYQSPEKEAANPYARWYCAVSSPSLHPPCANVAGKHTLQLEYGDAYVSTVKRGTHKLDYNPLTHQDTQTGGI